MNLFKFRQDMNKYYIDDIKIQQPIGDYLKMLNLYQIFLRRRENTEIKIRT